MNSKQNQDNNSKAAYEDAFKMPLGYKRTEVGLIPDDWDVVDLGKTCTQITTGKLDANAMEPNGKYRFYTCAKDYYHIDTYAFDTEALLVSGNGANVGYIHYFKGKFNAYQRTYVLSGFSESIIYLQHFLGQRLVERIRVEVNAGNTPYITRSTLTEMKVALPSNKTEQRAIAEALSDVDGLIAALDRLIEKKRAIKQATMQQLLSGKTRLPGFSGEWEKKIIEEIAIANWGNTLITKTSYHESGFQAYSASGPDGYVDWYEHETPAVVLSAIGAQCGKTWLACGKWTPIKNTIWFRGIEGKSNTSFLYWITNDPIIWPNRGQAQPFIALGDVRSLMIPIPSMPEQTAIATVLIDMDNEIKELEKRREKVRLIKQGMMQELLTGRIRLVKPLEAEASS